MCVRSRQVPGAEPSVFGHHSALNPHLAYLAAPTRGAILDDRAPSTLSSYLTGWNRFKSFHNIHMLNFPSTDVQTLSSFITYTHSAQHIRAPSIQAYLAGINFSSNWQ